MPPPAAAPTRAAFALIPVLDLQHGQVVRAVRGQRADYQPLHSTLCADPAPAALAAALCAHCAATRLYIADLDAIAGRGLQRELLRQVMAALPACTLWLDAGFADADAAAQAAAALGLGPRLQPVFGSESLRGPAALSALPGNAVLSLDRRGGQWLDPARCWQQPQRWPRRVIVMTLDCVGADAGPDLDTLRRVQALRPDAGLYGAGGIRDAADLDATHRAGAHGWLVASALHDGRLPRRPG